MSKDNIRGSRRHKKNPYAAGSLINEFRISEMSLDFTEFAESDMSLDHLSLRQESGVLMADDLKRGLAEWIHQHHP